MPRKTKTGVSRRKWADTPGGGIPRTQAEANALGLEKVAYSALSSAEKKRAIPISSASATTGSLALVIPPGRRKVTPGPQAGTYIVCYYNPVTGSPDFNCHILTAEQLKAGYP